MQRFAIQHMASARGFVSLSVDVGDGRPPAMADLLAQFNRHNVAATWTVCDPAKTPLVAAILGSRAPHEVGLLVGPTEGLDRGLSRNQFFVSVIGRLQTAAKKQIPISSVGVSNHWQPQHLDLLTKYGVSIVRAPQARGNAMLRPLAYGLWQLPAAASLVGGGWMAGQTQTTRALRAIGQVAAQGGSCHLQIDAQSLAQGDAGTMLRLVDRLLAQLVQMRASGAIAIETLREAAGRLQPKRTQVPARSILRAA
jgi:hypothetical protein